MVFFITIVQLYSAETHIMKNALLPEVSRRGLELLLEDNHRQQNQLSVNKSHYHTPALAYLLYNFLKINKFKIIICGLFLQHYKTNYFKANFICCIQYTYFVLMMVTLIPKYIYLPNLTKRVVRKFSLITMITSNSIHQH